MARLMRFMPATSTMEGMKVTSLVPAKALTSPPPTVDTITFGTPTGSSRMAVVASEVPPLPPMPMMPSRRPSPCRRLTTAASPRAMVAIASSLCPPDARCARSPPPAAHTSARATSGANAGSPITPKSTTRVARPAPSISSLTNAKSAPLVSNAPTSTTVSAICSSRPYPTPNRGIRQVPRRLTTAGRGPSGSGCGRRSPGFLPGRGR